MNYKPEGPSDRQIEVLYEILDPHSWPSIKTMTRLQAWELINHHSRTWRTQPASEKQQRFLQSQKQWVEGMLKGEATALIGRILDEKNGKHKDKQNNAPACQPNAQAPPLPTDHTLESRQPAGNEAALSKPMNQTDPNNTTDRK